MNDKLFINDTRLLPRASQPDTYTPHNPPLLLVAMGDSFTAGPGAGGPFDPDHPDDGCYRSAMSYPAQMINDPAFNDQALRFLA
jgi:hypothetical protein